MRHEKWKWHLDKSGQKKLSAAVAVVENQRKISLFVSWTLNENKISAHLNRCYHTFKRLFNARARQAFELVIGIVSLAFATLKDFMRSLTEKRKTQTLTLCPISTVIFNWPDKKNTLGHSLVWFHSMNKNSLRGTIAYFSLYVLMLCFRHFAWVQK